MCYTYLRPERKSMKEETKMINFRMKPEEVILLDTYAKQQGVTRSDYIKRALNQAFSKSKDGTSVDLSGRTRRGEKVKECPFGGSPAKCSQADWRVLPTKVKVCTTCGIKRAPAR